MDTLLDSGKYSDMRITCQGRTWKVHRSVVCTRSPVFEAMIDGESKEARSGVIDLPTDQPDIVEMMLRFLYQGDYGDTRYSKAPKEAVGELRRGALLVNAQVYIMADKHDISALKELARKKYTETVGELWQAGEFMDSAELVFEKTLCGDSLRKVIIDTAATHVQTLIQERWFVKMLKGKGELAVEVLKGVLAQGVDTRNAYSGAQLPKRRRRLGEWHE